MISAAAAAVYGFCYQQTRRRPNFNSRTDTSLLRMAAGPRCAAQVWLDRALHALCGPRWCPGRALSGYFKIVDLLIHPPIKIKYTIRYCTANKRECTAVHMSHNCMLLR